MPGVVTCNILIVLDALFSNNWLFFPQLNRFLSICLSCMLVFFLCISNHLSVKRPFRPGFAYSRHTHTHTHAHEYSQNKQTNKQKTTIVSFSGWRLALCSSLMMADWVCRRLLVNRSKTTRDSKRKLLKKKAFWWRTIKAK